MLCQACNEKPATFYYSTNINGHITKQHLCATCAKTVEDVRHNFSKNPHSFLEELFHFSPKNPQGHTNALPKSYHPRNGTLGTIPFDPQTFTATKESAIPACADESFMKRRQLNALKTQLKNCIKAENFEQAANLRDEIFKREQEE